MHLKGIHHVAINVIDLDDALAFYVDKLGLEILERPDSIDVPGYWLQAGAQEIHLACLGAGKAPRDPHFAFYVDDIVATINELESLEIKVSKPVTIEGTCCSVFIRDPSGNLIEFNQRL